MAKAPAPTVDNVVSLAKRRGFVYPCGEIYGGTRSAWDYGPLGVELKDNIKRQWWKSMVQMRDDMVGLDSAVILPRKTWEASGHVATFSDPLTECQSCHKRFRADHLQEEYADQEGHRATRTRSTSRRSPAPTAAPAARGPSRASSPACSRPTSASIEDESGLHYLRPETAQGIFLNFANVVTTQPQEAAVRHRPDRQELPQRDHARQLHLPHPRVRADGDGVLRQARRGRGVAPVLDRRAHPLVHRPRHRPRQPAALRAPARRSSATTPSAPSTSSTASASPARSGASSRASRTAPTSTSPRTRKHSGQDLSYFDQANNERYTPYVIEPAAGLSRSLMTFLVDAYTEDEAPNTKGGVDKRTVLRLDPRLAPVKVAVLPLSRNADLSPKAKATSRRAAPQLERRLRRLRRDRPPLPPPGRDRHAVLRHGRLRDPRGRRGHRPRAGLDEAGADRPRRHHPLLRRAPRRLLRDALMHTRRMTAAASRARPWRARALAARRRPGAVGLLRRRRRARGLRRLGVRLRVRLGQAVPAGARPG